MVKFVGQSTTIGISNTDVAGVIPNSFISDVILTYFTYITNPAFSVVTPHVVTTILPTAPTSTYVLNGDFHTEIDAPLPSPSPAFVPTYTGTIHTILVLKGGLPAYKIKGLDLSLTELQAYYPGAPNSPPVVLMADIFKGDDIFKGTDVSDLLRGFAGNDQMFGKGGIDYLFGDGGKDLLDGGDSFDFLWGRAGKDVFRFSTAPNTATNFDFVNDWEHKDQFQLKNSIFSKLTADVNGHVLASQFNVGAAPADGNDYLNYDPATKLLTYDTNGNGAGGSNYVALVVSPGGVAAALTNADFDLI